MRFKVLINGIYDVSESVESLGKEIATKNSEAYITAARKFVISDTEKILDPFGTGILAIENNAWKNLPIEVWEEDVKIYSGLIQDVRQSRTKTKRNVIIDSSDSLGSIIKFAVEANDSTTHKDFVVDGFHGAGNRVILIKNGLTKIPDISVVSTDVSRVPSYQVMDAYEDSPTTQIELDRGTETILEDGTPLRFSVPLVTTAGQELKSSIRTALEIIGHPGRIDIRSFDAIIEDEILKGLYFWIYVRKEDGVTLGAHINKLLTLGDLLLRTDKNGVISLTKGLQWDGFNPLYEITEDIMLHPVEDFYDKTELIWAVNFLYRDGSVIGNATQQLDPGNEDDLAKIRQWSPTKAWTPISPEGENVIGHEYLANSKAVAEYFGERRMNYFSVGRLKIKCKLRDRFPSGAPLEIKQFDEFLLSAADYEKESCRIMSFSYNSKSGIYDNVVIALTNRIYPNLPKPGSV